MIPRIAIVYLSYYSAETFLPDVVSSLRKMTYPKDKVTLVLVHNPGEANTTSVQYINNEIVSLSGKDFPEVVFFPQQKNLGFAGGCNVGIRWALQNGFDYVYLHNNDGFAAADFLEPSIAIMEKDKTIGAAQSLMLLYPETNLINSAGNAYHYLGIGYCDAFRKPKDTLGTEPLFESGYVSGGAVLLRSDLLKKYGILDEDYFLYHEDLEYSLRLQSVGFRTVVVRNSIFYHKYNFGRSASKFYYIERNRWALLLTYYKLATLMVLAPIFMVWELGILWFALRNGWLLTKLKTYGYWLQASHWQVWLGKRSRAQSVRTISDRTLLKNAVSQIVFDEKNINTPLLRYVANPLLAAYWWCVKKILFW